MASSTSELGDLEKAYAATTSSQQGNEAKNGTIGKASLNNNIDGNEKNSRDCEGWAAGQDALTPVCSRAAVGRLPGEEEESTHTPCRGNENQDYGSGDESDDENEDATSPTGVLGRVLSRMTSKSSVDPGPPPDGGWVAWSQCLVGHLVIFTTW
ncbi:hypothetical protein NQ176_g11039 [Zarea fungicola]|uniref:Uncharacterized protein n=1 Tax=Zarea fungicola TaxID=93591 RepID=A0ACC1MCB3_9HYPO|nr:hypothetical protein NQ176_g11039 [Lecanicillium fungicola]